MKNSTQVWLPGDLSALSLGADEVVAAIQQQSEQHDQEINIIRNGSRGMVWLEPLLEVQLADGRRIGYGPVTAADVSSLFAKGALQQAASDHPLYLGEVEAIGYFKQQQRLTFERVGVIDPRSFDDYKRHGGYQGLAKALAMKPQAIVDEIKSSGLRGRGGAAFPTGIKWQTVLDADPVGANPTTQEQRNNTQKYIVCNADEGDSGTFADRMLMEGDPFMLIEGMTIAGLAVNATKGYIYLRSEYPHAQAVLQSAIDSAYTEGYLGKQIAGSEHCFDLELRMAAGAYICGEETALLESLEGKRGMVRAKPPLPAIEGLFGQPTVVNNVISLATVTTVLHKGAEYYKNFGQGRSQGTLPFQLAGNIKRGGLIELAFGITLRQIIEDFGGGTITGRPVKAVQVGGPLGPYLPESQWDTPIDYEQYAAMQAVVGHGGIVVFDDSVDMAEQAQFSMEFCAFESCGKCTPCRVGAVRGAETLSKIRDNEQVQDNLILLQELCDTMVDGSLCAMGGMTPFPVRSAVKYFPSDFSG